MPAKSKGQQRLFGMALALERGKMPKSKASKKVKAISKGMSEKEIEDFAKTKHKGLKEGRALSFDAFVNEAYIDDQGKLRDFNFTPEDEYEMEIYSELEGITDLLVDSGARSVRHSIQQEIVTFYFVYRGSQHLLEINLDAGTAQFSKMYDGEVYTIFDGDAYSLFDYIQAKGLDFI